jgi:hypothetical protein
MKLSFTSVSRLDEPFLLAIYATVRAAEMNLVPWTNEQKDAFLRSQFQAQQNHYRSKYPHGSFQIIKFENKKIGCLYVGELEDEVRIIDLTILPEYHEQNFETEIVSDILKKATKPVRIYLENLNYSDGLIYKRLGFQMISDEGIYQLWECGEVGNKSLQATG